MGEYWYSNHRIQHIMLRNDLFVKPHAYYTEA